MFTGHDCKKCPAQGDCTIEMTVKFENEHPGALDELQQLMERMGSWKTTLEEELAEHGINVEDLILISIGTGFVLGKGAEPMPVGTSDQILNRIRNIMADKSREN